MTRGATTRTAAHEKRMRAFHVLCGLSVVCTGLSTVCHAPWLQVPLAALGIVFLVLAMIVFGGLR